MAETKKEEKPTWKPKPGKPVWPSRNRLTLDFIIDEGDAVQKHLDHVASVYGKEYVSATAKKFKGGLVEYIVPKVWTTRKGIDGYPPLQPITLLIETAFPEPLYYDLVDNLAGTSGLSWTFHKLRETLALAPMTQMHGTMLAKRSAQERDAKEMLGMVQTLKTVVLNLEGDLEKLKEQRDAFKEDKIEKVKAIFIDNYGGQGRTWTALARNVPLIKSALTWFLRLQGETEKKMMDEVETLVKDGKLNPAVANFLRRKIQEYWDWKKNYSDYIQLTYDRITQNLKDQRANLALYSKWAKEHIAAAEQMFVDISALDLPGMGSFVEEMPKWSPRAGTLTEFFAHDAGGQAVKDLAKPWIPCIFGKSIMTFNPDTPQHKFTRAAFLLGFGIIHEDDIKMIEGILTQTHDDLGEFMAEQAGMTDAEIMKAFEKTAPDKKPQKQNPIEASFSWWNDLNEGLLDNLANFLGPFGVSIFEIFKTRKRKAEWFAHNTFLVFYNNYKTSLGLPTF